MKRIITISVAALLIAFVCKLNAQTTYLEGGIPSDQYVEGMDDGIIAGEPVKGEEHFLFKNSGNNPLPMACAGTILASGLPSWTNWWAGYMLNINNINSTNGITINCFEARFGGNAGYRIYTKTGTFIGFESNAGAWTLIQAIGGGVSGTGGATNYSPIPITVNVTIPAGATQAFYLTRTNNNTSNRHMYVTGPGPAGTAVYASDANLELVEAHYIDTYFINSAPGQNRRPTLRVYYDINPLMPTELISFKAALNNEQVTLNWATATEINTDYFAVERSSDGKRFQEIARIKAAGNSSANLNYSAIDTEPESGISYYRLKQVDLDGKFDYSDWATVKFDYTDFELEIYPNPVNNEDMNIYITGELQQSVLVEIVDYFGNTHYRKQLALDNGHRLLNIGANEFAAGIYFVKAISNGSTSIKKFVIQ